MNHTINFRFITKKWANFYFFIYNLSECHFSCRKNYNELWIKKTGPLSEEEKSALAKFKTIRNRYHETKSIFEKAFFFTESPCDGLKQETKADEVKAIEEIFDIFKPRFEQLYKEDLPLLKGWEDRLFLYANDKKRNAKIVQRLESFYNSSLEEDHVVKCFFLLSPLKNGGGGGANVDRSNTITCEMSHNTPENIGRIAGTIWHETTHLLFEKPFLMPLLKEYFKGDMKKVSTLRELVNSSLFPRGLLGAEFFQTKPSDTLHNRFKTNKSQASSLAALSGEYIDNKKCIDKSYVARAARCLELS